MSLLPEQCRAARALLDWTQIELAGRANVSRSTVRDFEGGKHALSEASEAQIVTVLEDAGVCFLPPGSMGAGVRLRRADSAGQRRRTEGVAAGLTSRSGA